MRKMCIKLTQKADDEMDHILHVVTTVTNCDTTKAIESKINFIS